MLEHLVFIKVSDETKIEAAAEALMKLKGKIPQIIEISAGKNFAGRSQGYQLGLRVKMANKEDLAIYQVHPAHLELVETIINPIKVDVIAMDYLLN